MTTPKDMSRPASQHRPSVGSHPSSLPNRNAYNRTPSSTAAHRINRRKSSTFSPAANAAALGAAVESAVADGSVSVRRSSMSRNSLAVLNDSPRPPIPGSLPKHASHNSGSALVDGPSLASMGGIEKSKPKMRRASDGTRLTKKEKAAAGELKCETCGKAYKHGSCLTKHLWEHTPQWQYTSKLLISKHQQVQLLEAASVLVAMNQENGSGDSDTSSPPASGSSDMRDDSSSAETTPPPHLEHSYRDSKRFSNTSSAYSRSYQSFGSESAPDPGHAFLHHRQWSASSNRPGTANPSIAESYEYRDEDPADLAAAVGLLSCSYGTPKSGPTGMPSNIPPVPPLPAKYANNFTAFGVQEDVDMDGDGSEPDAHPARIDEVDEGVFGKMD